MDSRGSESDEELILSEQKLEDLVYSRITRFERNMRIPEEMLKKYVFGPILGTGQFSVVRKITDKTTGEEYALKIIDRSLTRHDPTKREIDILKKVNHPNVIALHEVYELDLHIFVVMELVSGGEVLDELVKRGCFSERDAAHIIEQIACGVKYLHSQGIVHRDLKPENLLFSDSTAMLVKIADFGLARLAGEQVIMLTPCGTPVCVAPEILEGEGYGIEVDMWTVGVVLYILLCGYPPFQEGMDGDHFDLLYNQIMKCDYKFDEEHWSSVSDEAKDLVSKLLVVDPKKRYTAQQTLEHPWVAYNKRGAELGSLQAMKDYNVKRKLKVVLSSLFLSSETQFQNPTEKQLSQWHFLFKQHASKSNNLLTIPALKTLVEKLGLDKNDPKLKSLTLQHPPSHAFIDFEQFVYFAKILLVKPTINDLQTAFKRLDKNSDGSISYSDMHEVLSTHHVSKSEEDQIMKITKFQQGMRMKFGSFCKLMESSDNVLRGFTTSMEEIGQLQRQEAKIKLV